MDRTEGALRVAEQALREARAALDQVAALRDQPKAPKAFIINDAGDLVLTFGDGTVSVVGRLRGDCGPQGLPGVDGKDGFGLDDLQVEFDGERRISLRFVRGDQSKESVIVLGHVLDRGVYHDGAAYERGDAVSFGGSLFIAQKDTITKPETPKSDWRLAAKRGRDGKEGLQGRPGVNGKDGTPGRDLTQMGTDGKKW